MKNQKGSIPFILLIPAAIVVIGVTTLSIIYWLPEKEDGKNENSSQVVSNTNLNVNANLDTLVTVDNGFYPEKPENIVNTNTSSQGNTNMGTEVNTNENPETNSNIASNLNTVKSNINLSIEQVDLEEITYLDKKYIISEVANESFEAEGFFVDRDENRSLFIYAKFTEDPNIIENFRKSMAAVDKGVGNATYQNIREDVTLYYASKQAMKMENRLLSLEQYQALAQETRTRGGKTTYDIVYYQDVEIVNSVKTFMIKDITSIDGITMTTGGSVNLFTLHFKEGSPLSIRRSTEYSTSVSDLQDLIDQIRDLSDTEAQIITKDLSFQDTIYTVNGIRTGWVAAFINTTIDQ